MDFTEIVIHDPFFYVGKKCIVGLINKEGFYELSIGVVRDVHRADKSNEGKTPWIYDVSIIDEETGKASIERFNFLLPRSGYISTNTFIYCNGDKTFPV
jgi:hypothetical protein